MSNDKVIDNYKHGELLKAIENALTKMGKSVNEATVELLGPVDEFHIGGRTATDRFIGQLNFKAENTILDLGCGLGGSARHVAHKINCKVEGIDLCEEYVETGKALNKWVKLDSKINLRSGSALDLPYRGNTFNGAYLFHVGMNIENKKQLFKEVARVLKPGATFGIYDVMKVGAGDINYPTPWASNSSISKLATPDEYKIALKENGFEIQSEANRKEFALEFFSNMEAKAQEFGGPPPLSLHTLMQASTPVKIQNVVDGIVNGIISPVEIIAMKK